MWSEIWFEKEKRRVECRNEFWFVYTKFVCDIQIERQWKEDQKGII